MTSARILALLGLVALGACETVEGFGQDVQTAGAVVSQEARAAK